MFNAEFVLAEIESILGEVDGDHFHIHELEKFKRGQADGAGTDDHDGFARLRVAAFDGVISDGESFNEGELIVGKIISGVKLVCGNGPIGLTKSTGLVDANNGNV